MREKAFDAKQAAPTELTYADSLKVLQVDEPYSKAAVEEKFDRLWQINDPIKGGSFYLACKLVGARKVLLRKIDIDPDRHVKP